MGTYSKHLLPFPMYKVDGHLRCGCLFKDGHLIK